MTQKQIEAKRNEIDYWLKWEIIIVTNDIVEAFKALNQENQVAEYQDKRDAVIKHSIERIKEKLSSLGVVIAVEGELPESPENISYHLGYKQTVPLMEEKDETNRCTS